MLVCGYALDSVGIEGNKDFMSRSGAYLGAIDGPWIYAADHNVDPQQMQDSGWLATIGGRIVAPAEATCRAGNGSTFDFLVLSHHFLENAWAEV